MPTFPSHWAGISGTIEEGETPHQAAQRELSEETNVIEQVEEQGGLYLDVPYLSPSSQKERTIRVYPFVVHVPPEVSSSLALRGTEHDRYQIVSIDRFEEMESECVPGLVRAFHHATYGAYDKTISPAIREWASDVKNGASVMTANALKLLFDNQGEDDDWRIKAGQITMMRPSMVPICNVMGKLIEDGKKAVTPESFQMTIQKSVVIGVNAVNEAVEDANKQLTIATFSRSGTLRQVLCPFLDQVNVVCGKSSPGNEGELMVEDLNGSTCISDLELKNWLTSGKIDLLLVGSDCILPEAKQMINKVGTHELCQVAHQNRIPVFCCADRWKVWHDTFPPPLEQDLFELVPLDLITKLLVPMED